MDEEAGEQSFFFFLIKKIVNKRARNGQWNFQVIKVGRSNSFGGS